MLVTARKALVKLSWRATSMALEPMGRSTATSPTVMRTARVMEMQARDGESARFLRRVGLKLGTYKPWTSSWYTAGSWGG